MRSEEFALKLKNLPDSPGCYLMKCEGRIIYVGKAVNLKNRVRQYFQSSKNHTPAKSGLYACKATRQESVVQITVTGRNGRIVQGKHRA